MAQALDVPAGGLFMFSRGAYSNYGYCGHFLAMEPLDKSVFDAVCEAIMDRIRSGEIMSDSGVKIDLSDTYDVGSIMDDHFVPEMIRTGKIIAVDCVEIHTGSYGEFDLI